MEKKGTVKPGLEISDVVGRTGGGGSSPFSLKGAKPMYEIWSKSQNKKVSEARTLKGAFKAIDRRDNEYGGYDHYKKKIGQ